MNESHIALASPQPNKQKTSLSVWFSLGMTSMLVTSHVSLLWLLRLYKYEQVHPVTWYLVVLILLTVPCMAEVIYWLWTTPIINTCARNKLPPVRHLCLGLLSSTLEGVALAAFGAEVAHALPEPVLLTLPSSVMALAIVKDILSYVKNLSQSSSKKLSESTRCRRAGILAISALLAIYPLLITSLVGVLLCFWSRFEFSSAQCVVASTSVFLLSTTWDSEVMSLTILSFGGNTRCSRVQMIYASVKAVAITITLFLSLTFKVALFRNYPYEHLIFAFKESAQFGVFTPVFLCCFGGLFSFLLCVAASKVCLITPVLQISMFLSPMLAIVLSAILWNDFDTGAFWEVSADDLMSCIVIVLSAGTWLIPIFASAFQRLGNAQVANRKLTESFYSFSWSPFFWEPRLVLNYEKYSILPFEDMMLQNQELKNSKPKSGGKTVFICTTMYKETEAEMSRYLCSIKSTLDHDWEQLDTRVEAHVVFDSSISSGEINGRGRHFLGLLCGMFDLNDTDLHKFSTPYGCQIEILKIVKTHSMLIHFKDPTKVKAKKRWSQVMYMHYVLKVRSHPRDNYQYNKEENNSKSRCSQIPINSVTTGTSNFLKADSLSNNDASELYRASQIRCVQKHEGRRSACVRDLNQVYVLTTDADTG
ncbi:hypothetical protein RRG08_021335 [Elysia crispata]|uniref:Uncharacterized protein n=1 Tax=Elysia crispata TaxID=231223 RepID=A0AAE1AZV2_9GAST|nr:hypothetical protein RRG08_021335 [Elysia crispata]